MQPSTCSSPPPQISDFGLSCVLGSVHSKINSNLYGTVTHQPPETLKDNVVSYAGDVYAFGVLMWQVWGKVWMMRSILCWTLINFGSESVDGHKGFDLLFPSACNRHTFWNARSLFVSLYMRMTDHLALPACRCTTDHSPGEA